MPICGNCGGDSTYERHVCKPDDVARRQAGHQVKVCIDTPGPTITVEAVGTVDAITDKAFDLYRKTLLDWPKDPTPRGAGFSVASSTERSGE